MTEALESDGGLFDYDAPPPVSLYDRFGMPPFSILDRRQGQWQDRKRKWLSLGIRSELGRDGGLIYDPETTGMGQGLLRVSERSTRALEAIVSRSPSEEWRRKAQDALDGRDADGRRGWDGGPEGTPRLIPGAGDVGGAYDRSRPERTLNGADSETLSGTSIFDPVLAELAYRWFTAPHMRILDPFAGGSVRGVVAGVLERHYMGIDLRGAQIDANKQQGRDILGGSKFMPRWVAGDSAEVLAKAPAESVDALFSCPPYADLEVYSDDPRDISGMPYEQFLEVHEAIIAKACAALKPDRFAAWVISDVRDKKTGCYRGLPGATVEAFKRAGLGFYNEQVVLDPVGSAAVRAGRIFLGGRKTTRMHQLMLVFVKGDWKRATEAISSQPQVLEVLESEANQ